MLTSKVLVLALKYILIYLSILYWVPLLFLLLDRLSLVGSSSKIFLYGQIDSIPYQLVFYTIGVLFLSWALKKKTFNSQFGSILFRPVSPDIELIFSFIYLITVVIIAQAGSSGFRYDSVILSASPANLMLSMLSFANVFIWLFKSSRYHQSGLKWYFSSFCYIFASFKIISGFGSLIGVLIWIYYILTNPSSSGTAILTNLLKVFTSAVFGKLRIKSIGLFAFATLLMYNILNTSFINAISAKEGEFIASEFRAKEFIHFYLIDSRFNQPEIFTSLKAPMLSDNQRSVNLANYIESVRYRYCRIMACFNLDLGEPPPITNIKLIANYQYGAREGTTPGLLGSFAIYLPFQYAFMIEAIYLLVVSLLVSFVTFRFASGSAISQLLIVNTCLKILLNSPLSTISVFDETFLFLIALVIWASIPRRKQGESVTIHQSV